MQMAEKFRVFTLLQKGDSVIAVARYWGLKTSIILIKMVGFVITSRDDTEEELVLWRT